MFRFVVRFVHSEDTHTHTPLPVSLLVHCELPTRTEEGKFSFRSVNVFAVVVLSIRSSYLWWFPWIGYRQRPICRELGTSWYPTVALVHLPLGPPHPGHERVLQGRFGLHILPLGSLPVVLFDVVRIALTTAVDAAEYGEEDDDGEADDGAGHGAYLPGGEAIVAAGLKNDVVWHNCFFVLLFVCLFVLVVEA